MRTFLRFLWYATWSHRVAALVIAGACAFLIYSEASLYGSSLHGDSAEHARFVAGMSLVGAQFTYLTPPPVHLERFTGYLEWRFMTRLYNLLPIYCIVVGAAVIRGAEDRGLVEHWLAEGLSRTAMVVARVLAMALMLVLVCAVVALVGLKAAQANRVELPLLPLFTSALMPALVALIFFCLSLALSQVLRSRAAAAGAVAALSMALLLLANISFAIDSLSVLRWISPYYLAYRSHPLVDGGAIDGLPTTVLLGLMVVLGLVAVAACRRRDIGQGLLPSRGHDEVAAHRLLPYPGNLYLAAAWDLRWLVGWWTLGAALMGVLMGSVTPTITAAFGKSQSLGRMFAGIHISTARLDLAFTGFSIGALLVPLLTGMVITVVARWASDQDDRRTEMVLAAAVSPMQVHLARLTALLGASVVMAAVTGGATLVATGAAGVDLRAGHPWVALVTMVPVPVAVGTIGAAMMPRAHRLAVVVLSLLVGEGFMILLFASFSKLPDWVVSASLFRAYGSPLTDGVNAGGMELLLVVAAVAVGVTLAQSRVEVEVG